MNSGAVSTHRAVPTTIRAESETFPTVKPHLDSENVGYQSYHPCVHLKFLRWPMSRGCHPAASQSSAQIVQMLRPAERQPLTGAYQVAGSQQPREQLRSWDGPLAGNSGLNTFHRFPAPPRPRHFQTGAYRPAGRTLGFSAGTAHAAPSLHLPPRMRNCRLFELCSVR